MHIRGLLLCNMYPVFHGLCTDDCVLTVSWMEKTSCEVESIQSSLQSMMNMVATTTDAQLLKAQVESPLVYVLYTVHTHNTHTHTHTHTQIICMHSIGIF